MITRLLARLIGWLMRHANTGLRTHTWYNVKDRLCDRFGVPDGCDVQVMPAKVCHSCDGTGRYRKYIGGGMHEKVSCWNCGATGIYQNVTYVKLHRTMVGAHVFHRPGASTTSPHLASFWAAKHRIEGRIEHKRTRWSGFCLWVLFMLFDFKRFAPHFVRSIMQRVFRRQYRWYHHQQYLWWIGIHPLQRAWARIRYGYAGHYESPDNELPF